MGFPLQEEITEKETSLDLLGSTVHQVVYLGKPRVLPGRECIYHSAGVARRLLALGCSVLISAHRHRNSQ